MYIFDPWAYNHEFPFLSTILVFPEVHIAGGNLAPLTSIEVFIPVITRVLIKSQIGSSLLDWLYYVLIIPTIFRYTQ